MKSKICRLHGQHDLRIEEHDVSDIGPSDVLIEIARGGICGSDLHYYQDGGIGTIRVREPIILGHEVAGVVSGRGEDVVDLELGDKVAINPSQPCLHCSFCEEGNFQHCKTMRFMGSARTLPHVQGGFRENMVLDRPQCHKISDHISLEEAACAEPLAVCLHARNQVKDLRGKRVLVTGAGPIGALCAAVSAQSGASMIAITDLHDFTLAIAQKMGATHVINVLDDRAGLDEHVAQSGPFDVVFECSAAEAAIHTALQVLRPRGTLIQVGVTGNLNLPINAIVGKEIAFKGTHRFHTEFAEAVKLINTGAIDVKPMITQIYPIDKAVEAFALAGDRSKAMKVQLSFS